MDCQSPKKSSSEVAIQTKEHVQRYKEKQNKRAKARTMQTNSHVAPCFNYGHKAAEYNVCTLFFFFFLKNVLPCTKKGGLGT